jgi:hypothetical protein
MKFFTLLGFILCLSTSANAQSNKAKFDMVGIGAIACKKWNETESDDFLRGTAVQWVYGYFSGRNSDRAKKKQTQFDLRGINAENILETIDNFCYYYPDYRLHFAADSLVGKVIFLKRADQPQ